MALFKREDNTNFEKRKTYDKDSSSQVCQPEYDVRQAYTLLWDILKLKPIRSLAIILLTAKVIQENVILLNE